MSAFPYHPDYGYDDELRQRVVNHVKETGCTQREAARTFDVSNSTVGLWVRGIRRQDIDRRKK